MDCYDNKPGAKLVFSITISKEIFFVRNSGSNAPYKANHLRGLGVWRSRGDIVVTTTATYQSILQSTYVAGLGLPRKGTWYTDENAKLHLQKGINRRQGSNKRTQ
jgi:hypothetical protein